MSNHAREMYQCPKCFLTVEIATPCGCKEPCMRCCGEKLLPVKVNTVDADKDKHLPVITLTGQTVHVKIGSVEHPMLNAHHIMWIEFIYGDKICRKYLNPGDKPEAEFHLCACQMEYSDKIKVRAFCNMHGLWENEL